MRPLTHILTALIGLTAFMISDAVGEEEKAPLVRIRLRTRKVLYAQIASYNKGNYRVLPVDGKSRSLKIAEISEITYKPDVPKGFLNALKNRKRTVYRPPTEAEIFQMAIKELQNERKEDRRKRMEQAKGNIGQLGLGSLVNKITDDIQDNLIGMLAEDRELQSIIMDKDVQKTMEGGNILSLMNNEKILNLMRNKKKLKKLTGAIMGDDEDEKKAATKKKKKEENAPATKAK